MSLLQEGYEQKGAHSRIPLTQHLKKIKLGFCEADLCWEKYKKIEFVGSGSSERVPVPGEKKGRVLLLRGRKQSGVSACSVGMAVARQSRLLAGSGRHDTANQIPIDLTLFFLAVPATELNHNSGKPTGVFLWDADGFLSILGHAIPHLNVVVTLRSLAFRAAISWPLQ